MQMNLHKVWDVERWIKCDDYINNCQEVEVVGIGDASSRVALPFIT